MILSLFASLALADAIDGPPENCPRGSWGQSSHCGSECAPSTCDPAAPQCWPEGSACEADVGICISTYERSQSCGRMPEGPDNPRVTVEVANGSCSKDRDCDAGQTCVIAPRCVKPGGMKGMCPFASIGVLGVGLLGLLLPRSPG